MKLNSIVRNTTVAATSLALGLGTVACSRDYTAAYVYSTSASNGNISAYAVDYQSGELSQISGSPFPSTVGNNPVTLVAAPNNKFLYVVGGTQSNTVEEVAIGTDGKLYGQHTYNLATSTVTGTYPTAAAIDSTGSFLFVTVSNIGSSTLGPGGIVMFPINSDNSLGTAIITPLGYNPTGVFVAAPTCTTTPAPGNTNNTACTPTGGAANSGKVNTFVYVVDQEGSTLSTNAPNIVEFALNTTSGALTPLAGTTSTFGIKAGVTPSAIVVDPTGRYVYVTDKTSNQVIGFQIATTTSGLLTPLLSSPYTAGLYPVALTVDPRGKYLYTANYNSNTVSAYTINSSDGSLGGAASVGNFTTSTGPTCVTVEPALGIYLYTSNYLDASISGGQLSPNTGAVSAVPNTPFPSNTLPSCVVSVANGSHASSIINP